MEIVDSYSEANQNANTNLKDHHPSDSALSSAAGQSFTCTTSKKIVEAKFYMKKAGSPTGNGYAVLYAHSGTYGSSSLPTGSALATSDAFDVSTLTTSYQLISFTFTGAQQYTMASSTYYVIVFENPAIGTIDSDNLTILGGDSSSPTHSGNLIHYVSSAWAYSAAIDTCFYVYGDPAGLPMQPILTLAPKGGIGRPAMLTGGTSFGG